MEDNPQRGFDLMACPNCRLSVIKGSKFCPECGAAISPQTANPTPVAPTPLPPSSPSASRWPSQYNLYIFAGIGFALLFSAMVVAAMVNDPSVARSATPSVVATCSTGDGKKVYNLLKSYAAEWDDANNLAGSTSRIALAPQVADLQRIRRDVQAQQYPPCGQKAQAALVAWMDTTINGYVSFMKQDPESVTSDFVREASNKHFDFVIALSAIDGILPVTPTVKR